MLPETSADEKIGENQIAFLGGSSAFRLIGRGRCESLFAADGAHADRTQHHQHQQGGELHSRSAAITSVRCQLPDRAARMLPMGTKNAAQPFAV